MSLIEALNIGEKSLSVHGKRIKIHAKNIANIDTPNYVRKIPLLMAREDNSFEGLMNNMKENVFAIGTIPYLSGGVNFNGVVGDPRPGELIYQPGHPDADKNGYIRASNVNPLTDIADAMSASRAYEANLALIAITKTMAQSALDIGK